MLGLDALAQERWRRNEKKESLAERSQRLLEQDILSNTVTVAPDAGRDVTNWEAQLGRPLTAQQVMDRLKKCNHRFLFIHAKGYPLYGIYILDPVDGRTWINERGEILKIRHICGMGDGIMPEFTVIHKCTKRVANPELLTNKAPTRDVKWKEVDTYADQTRGWRTIVARLLNARLITESDVTRHFGWTPSHDSEKWAKLTR